MAEGFKKLLERLPEGAAKTRLLRILEPEYAELTVRLLLRLQSRKLYYRERVALGDALEVIEILAWGEKFKQKELEILSERWDLQRKLREARFPHSDPPDGGG